MIWVVISTTRSSAIIPSARCMRSLRRRGAFFDLDRSVVAKFDCVFAKGGRKDKKRGDFGSFLLTRMVQPCRQALRYIIRNTTLAPRVRAEAQLQLTQMHVYTNPTQIKNRCILGGRGRGILRDFKMSRASCFTFPVFSDHGYILFMGGS